MFSNQIYGTGHSPFTMKLHDAPRLMFIYGLGYVLIYLLFFLMYAHALKKKEQLELTFVEKFDTRTKLFSNGILILIGLLSLIISQVVVPSMAGIAGFVYLLIGPAFSLFHAYRARQRKKLPTAASANSLGDL